MGRCLKSPHSLRVKRRSLHPVVTTMRPTRASTGSAPQSEAKEPRKTKCPTRAEPRERLTKRPNSPTALLFSAALFLLACGTEVDEPPVTAPPSTARVSVYANSAFGTIGGPVEVFINGQSVGTLSQELNPPPQNQCDASGSVSVSVPLGAEYSFRFRRATDGASYGPFTQTAGKRCEVLWVAAGFFPPPGGGASSAVNDCVTIDNTSNSLATFFGNRCTFDISVIWFDQGSCGPNTNGDGSYRGCGISLRALLARSSATKLRGAYKYGACRSPSIPTDWRTLDKE